MRYRTRRPQGVSRPTPEDLVVSGSFLKAMLRPRAASSWRDCIIRGGRSQRPYRIPREGTVPKIPTALGRADKGLASRFFQLASGHAMIAPFLKDKLRWVDSDQCWWCSGGRQSREHLFKECCAWKSEIRELWKKVGEISSTTSYKGGDAPKGRENRKRRKKGFGFFSRENGVRPGNCTVGRLLNDSRFTEAVLEFLKDTQVGIIKKGVMVRGVEAA